VIIKYTTTLQTRRYTTVWNVCAQKSSCSKADWSKLLCKNRYSKQLLKIFI